MSSAKTSTRPICWGVIGAGGMATNRMAPAISKVKGTRIVGVASRSPEHARRFAEKFHVPSVYDSVDAMLANPAVDAVYVGSTNEWHYSHVLAAARAGKHVLCEKPIAMTLAEAAEMIWSCKKAGVVLGTNHYHRLKPSLRTCRQLIATGAIGKPLAASMTFAICLRADQQTWRISDAEAGGGVVRDLTVHDADIVHSVLDDDVVEVFGTVATRGTTDGVLEDCAAGAMRLRSGVLISFFDSFVTPNAVQGLSVMGSAGSITCDNAFRSDSDGTVTLRSGGTPQPVHLPRWEDPFEVEVRRFNAAIRGTGAPAATGEDGMRALAVALAVLESATEGRAQRVADIGPLLASAASADRP